MKHFIRAFKEIGTGLLGAISIIAAIGLPLGFMLFLCRWFTMLFGEFFAIIATMFVIVLVAGIALGIFYAIQERKENGND